MLWNTWQQLASPKGCCASLQRMRIYNPNPQILQALQGSNIELVLGIPNAKMWVQDNVKAYANVKFRYIVVGNEVKPSDPFAKFIVPAMQNIQTAVSEPVAGKEIRVTTAIESSALAQSSPPSIGVFRADYLEAFLDGVIKFLVLNHSPLVAKVHPYFIYARNPTNVNFFRAIFSRNVTVVKDGKFEYKHLFEESVDSGWPTSGGGNTTTLDYARAYNTRVPYYVRYGTPKRPAVPIEAYVSSMFDENQKTHENEKFWGLFLPDKKLKYS
ncbi:hypothetical protein Lal_00018122 [Lupinus albus]|uniref:glucan endo-1,3-beta-D-glucosidase n=1 Tax=Lupinus albus TaxID=3870 RepID=A0A6A4NF03_LUPAL|nr:putative glucan endo-1,3-beta-D-glucosidase [Lupinus albus]KAF1866737.1 hypothetical protein Lal_00018122 [Lupinus albus]